MTAANHLLVAMAESTNSRQRIEALYRSALELNAIDRQAFLDRVCADDESLRQEIDALLSGGAQTAAAARADDFPGSFLVPEPADDRGRHRRRAFAHP